MGGMDGLGAGGAGPSGSGDDDDDDDDVRARLVSVYFGTYFLTFRMMMVLPLWKMLSLRSK
jgi:hypothetical protein